jgi:hypothetical protein
MVYGRGGRRALEVLTDTRATGSIGYAGVRLSGARGADGSVAQIDRTDPDRPRAMVAWPDGRWAVASTVDPGGPEEAELVRIASSVRTLAPGDLGRLRAEGSAHLAALPEQASATLPSGTVSVRGEGTAALCLARPAVPVACASVQLLSTGMLASDHVTAGFVVGGVPFAATVTTGDPDGFGFRSIDDHGSSPWDASPVESVLAGGRRFLLTSPPPAARRDLAVTIVVGGQVSGANAVAWHELS